jgi:cytochrome c2
MRRLLFCVFMAGVLTAVMPSLSLALDGVMRTDKKGEDAFNSRCRLCHGEKGSGTDKGPPLVHRIYHPGHHSDLSFKLAVQRGVRAHHWRFGDMPRIEGVADEEIEAIIRFIRSLQKGAGIF